MTQNNAFFYDGKSAIKHEVVLNISISHFEIMKLDGVSLTTWDYQSLVLVDQMPETGQARLSHPASPEALLLIESKDTLASIRMATPALFKKKKRSIKSISFWVFLICAAVIGGFYGLSAGADGLAKIIPLSWEEPLAISTEKQVLAVFSEAEGDRRFCEHSPGNIVFKDMVERLSLDDTPEMLKSVRVVRSDIVNAFAIPGGRVFIFKGLIDKAKTEAEVAGVLAHEIGHVQKRHPLAGAIKQFGLSTVIKAISGGSDLAGAASLLVTFSYTRKAENEADNIAAHLLKQSGYGTKGLEQFFQRLMKKDKHQLPAFLSTHPSHKKRVKNLQNKHQSIPLIDSPNRIDTLRTICD
ncbi:MAG: M48 family metallopeptidase [Alphaproteobacteria bacterium]|nr:M48 family metallopeptidase [Rhodospirillales bacterium]MCW9044899.1 M48 family metallopeptidase [Alphaproteobacteria bacterium]